MQPCRFALPAGWQLVPPPSPAAAADALTATVAQRPALFCLRPKFAAAAQQAYVAVLKPIQADGELLTQLRQGYIDRDKLPFPASVVLVGQRQVRDYVLREQDRRAVAWLGTTSPFNITAEAQTLGPFTETEVGELLAQHTAAAGQRFSTEAAARIWQLGQGHPWLTNALADQIVRRDVKDRSVEVTAEHVEAAKETIILERRTHIDSLVARLREDRVRKIIAPMLVGGRATDDVLDDDFAYVLGLGLIRARDGHYEIANPIYAEVLPRALTYTQQMQIAKLRRDTETEDEALDQVVRYLDHLGLDEGWLVLFDLRSTQSWAERLTTREVEHRGKRVHVAGC